MLRWLRPDLHRVVCIAVAMLYALSIFVPHLAHARAPSQRTAEPFAISQHDHDAGAAHQHSRNATHHHAAAGHPASHSDHTDDNLALKCCAQIMLTILPQQAFDPAFTGLSRSPDFSPLVTKLTGRAADRLDRPPNV